MDNNKSNTVRELRDQLKKSVMIADLKNVEIVYNHLDELAEATDELDVYAAKAIEAFYCARMIMKSQTIDESVKSLKYALLAKEYLGKSHTEENLLANTYEKETQMYFDYPLTQLGICRMMASVYDMMHDEAKFVTYFGESIKLAKEKFGINSKKHIGVAKEFSWLFMSARYFDYLDTFMSMIDDMTDTDVWVALGDGYKCKYQSTDVDRDPKLLDKAILCMKNGEKYAK